MFGGIRGGPRPDKKADKKQDAELRAVVRDERGDRGQVERLDKMFGKGKGARKERAKLLARTAK